MIMKNNIIITLASVLLLTFTSCSDFLDRYPLDELSDASFWKLPSDAEMFVADIYQVLPSATGLADADVYSDNAVHGIKWAYASGQATGSYDPTAFGWSGEYKKIRACNVLIEKIEMIPDYATKDKEATIGEARFLRGYTYYKLIKSFGDVPYVEGTLDLSELKGYTRTPWKEVYNKVMDDFDYAISKLPSEWPSGKYGRATKGAAEAMKAQCALYFGEFETAATAAKNVIDSGVYELFDGGSDGSGFWEMFWEQNEINSEYVLVRTYDAVGKEHYMQMWETFPVVGWGGTNPTQNLVDAFECTDGKPITESPLYDKLNPRTNRDPRLAATVLFDGETMFDKTIKVAAIKANYPTGVGQQGDATATGYYQKKWINPNIYPSWKEGVDIPIIRYAEVLLTYAEAKNEISPLDASAFDAVNKVRERVKMPKLTTTNCPTQDALRQRIRNEWRVEFALEGKRMWDVRRWDIAMDVLQGPLKGIHYREVFQGDELVDWVLYDDGPGSKQLLVNESLRYAEHNKIYPVPQSEINLNKDLTQNPGY